VEQSGKGSLGARQNSRDSPEAIWAVLRQFRKATCHGP